MTQHKNDGDGGPRNTGDVLPEEALPAAREVERTGDDTPASSLWVYVWRMTGWHQAGAAFMAVTVALLNLAPIELQRRIVDDAITPGDMDLLIWLGAAYAGVVVAHQAAKFALGMYQGWLSESAVLYTRRHLMSLHAARAAAADDREAGRAVSVIGSEVDQLGGFVGDGPSQACVNLSMVIGVAGYMAVVEPTIAAFSLILLAPQILVTPMLQNKLNALIETRVGLVRELGDEIAAGPDAGTSSEDRLQKIFSNRLRYFFWKRLMKASLNLMSATAPLSVLVVGGWMAIAGDTTVGVLLAFVSGFNRVADPLRELITFYRNAAKAGVQHDMIARWM